MTAEMENQLPLMALPLADTFVRLLAAWVFGMLLGLERERHGRGAGLRTHGLVSAGSALFAVLSIAVAGEHHDPGRIAAGVVTGIGFIGAGAILRCGVSVHGLTTAASIWATAGIGMTCGFGWLAVAAIATMLVLLTLALLRPLAHALRPRAGEATITVTAVLTPRLIHDVAAAVEHTGSSLWALEIGPDQDGHQLLTVRLTLSAGASLSGLVAALSSLEGVAEAEAH